MFCTNLGFESLIFFSETADSGFLGISVFSNLALLKILDRILSEVSVLCLYLKIFP